jgi:hypothetical protein
MSQCCPNLTFACSRGVSAFVPEPTFERIRDQRRHAACWLAPQIEDVIARRARQPKEAALCVLTLAERPLKDERQSDL